MSGVYIHIPFCKSKCPYCDFYSYRCNDDNKEHYVNALCNEITTLSRCKNFIGEDFAADTLYLGGGTPTALSGESLHRIITLAKSRFFLPENAEITVECNPSSDIESIAPFLKDAGVNRISLGMQSAIDIERRTLGRTADTKRISRVIEIFRSLGIDNISLDIMLGIPFQTKKTLSDTVDFAVSVGTKHISAYMLKIEEGTHFHKFRDKYNFPDDDEVCELYNLCAETAEKAGFIHYEISNFALPGYESRHNTKYWLLEDYLGLGPSAHSCIGNKRFYFESDTEKFIKGQKPVFDSFAGDFEEYIMLRLRLKQGFSVAEFKTLYPDADSEKIAKKIPFLKEKGLVNFDGDNLSLTRNGFLLSNSIIAELI